MIIVTEKRIKRDIKFILKDSSEELCKKKLCMYWLADVWPTRAMLFTLKAVLRLVTTIIPWNSTAGKGKRKIKRHSLVLFWHRLMSNSASFAWLVVFGRNKGGFMIHMLPFKVLSINHKGEWLFWERSISQQLITIKSCWSNWGHTSTRSNRADGPVARWKSESFSQKNNGKWRKWEGNKRTTEHWQRRGERK